MIEPRDAQHLRWDILRLFHLECCSVDEVALGLGVRPQFVERLVSATVIDDEAFMGIDGCCPQLVLDV